MEQKSRSKQALYWEVASNVLLVFLYGIFAFKFGRDFIHTLRISSFLLLLKEGTISLLMLCRRFPKEVSFSSYEWAIALAATYAPFFFVPVGHADSVLGNGFQITGMVIVFVGLLSLNRSIGIVPANRGIQSAGLYKMVRHPLYMGYTISEMGFVMSQFSLFNIFILVAAIFMQVLRLLREEKFLSRDPEYRYFMERTRWHLLPFVF